MTDELDRLAAEAVILSSTDALTGLGNRPFLEDHIRLLASDDVTLGALMIDIDHFKLVNDIEGHAVGDVVLAEIARRLAGQLTGPAVVGRYGGEEFLVLVPEVDAIGAAMLGERLRGAVATTAVSLALGRSRPVTVSVGCAVGEAGSLVQTIQRAEIALGAAKAGGRNRVEVAHTLPLDA